MYQTTSEVEEIEIRPQPGPQEAFLSSWADIVLYGGAAGGGKTYGLLLEPTRHVNNGKFGAVIFRRSYPEIIEEGAMWDESYNIYSHLGAIPKIGNLKWTFPAGARVSFAHLQYERDLDDYKGAQIPLLEFDQLETFTERMFFYMMSRNRSNCGIASYIRATANPEPGWLADFIDWWIEDDGYADLSRVGVVRWFIRFNDVTFWADTKEELEERFPGSLPKSFTFILASLLDNKILMRNDPGYLANLQALNRVDRLRLLGDSNQPERGGNWKVKEEAGELFDRDWFIKITSLKDIEGFKPRAACRFFDLAASEKKGSDYTGDILMATDFQKFVIMDARNKRVKDADVEKYMVDRVERDIFIMKSIGCDDYRVRWEQEGGASGKILSTYYMKAFVGFDCKGIPSTGSKITRAKPMSSQTEAGNIYVFDDHWTKEYLAHMHSQPADHDDMMDGSSGAFNELAENVLSWANTDDLGTIEDFEDLSRWR